MRETDEEAALLGRIAVRYGFITMDQLAEATLERGRGGKKLGAILLERGMLDELALGKVLALQKRHRQALTKKAKPHAPKSARERIPTPRDWAFEKPSRSAIPPSPRRQRRTADVVRDRLEDAVEASPKARTPTFPVKGPAPLESDDVRQRTTAPEMPRVESDDAGARGHAVTPATGLSRGAVPLAERTTRPQMAAAAPSDRRAEPQRVSAVDKQKAERRAPSPVALRGASPDDGALELELALEEAEDLPAVDEPPIETEQRDDATSRPHADSELTQPAVAPPAADAPPADVVSAPTSAPTADEPQLLEPLPWTPIDSKSPLVAFLHELLQHAVRSQASDVHVHAGTVGRMRQLGQLVPITEEPLAASATDEALTAILTPWQKRVFAAAGEVDLAYEVANVGRFRANIYRQHGGTNGVFHVIPSSVPTLASLELPQALATLTNYPQGLILLTGPAGSGKTSTMAALTNIINEERADHILTIEDPIEYVFQSKRCIINQRQVGRHTESFASGLRGALREDPDIICIGELRDLETISLALSAAETGHLVLATLHTGSAIGTINRIVGAYPPGQQPQVRSMMSESLRAVTSQRLLPGTDGRPHVALETLFVTRAVGALIRDSRTFQIGSIMQTGRSQGMRMLDDSLRELLDNKKISEAVALAHCEDPRKLGGR